MAIPILKTKKLKKVYETRSRKILANNEISLEVYPGEIFGILGSNGAGKSTFIRQVVGSITKTSGEIYINGREMTPVDKELKSSIGYMTQGSLRALYHLKVSEAVYYTCRLHGQSWKKAKKNTKTLLELLDLEEHSGQLLKNLSGGLLQMVNFAISIVSAPEVLILDEPTSGLDPKRRKVIWEYIHKINKFWGTTIILVTHNVMEAEMLMERIAIFNNGTIISCGTPGELKQGVDQRLRVEIYLKPGFNCTDQMRRNLEQVGEFIRLNERHFIILIRSDQFINTLEKITNLVSLENIDDFRIGMTTLEDVYIKMAGEKID